MEEYISKRKVTVFNVFWSFKLGKIVIFAYIIEKLSLKAQECHILLKHYNFLRNLYAYTQDLCGSKKLWLMWSAHGYMNSGTQQCLACFGQHGNNQICARQ